MVSELVQDTSWGRTDFAALPHMTATSDIYEGMYIPKGELNEIAHDTRRHNFVSTGAIVLTNIWYVSHHLTDVLRLS